MKYHPDRNPNDKDAEHKFKEASEAYEILKDDQKRAAYDQFGHAAFQGGSSGPRGGRNPFGSGGFEGFDFSEGFSDIFGDIFGAGFGNRSQTNARVRGVDLRYNIQISLEEAFNGLTKEISFTASVKCTTCEGSRSADGKIDTCNTCHGSGRIRAQQGFFSIERTCPDCRGEGQKIKNPCKKCHGSGKTKTERKLSVNIPAGVEEGTRIRLAGEGEPGDRGGPSGDLYIFLSISPHELFERDGNDLHCKIPIKMVTATIGGEIEIPTIDGTKIKLKIPAGTQPDDKFKIRNKGMHKLKSTIRGDLYVHIIVEIPIKLTNEQEKLIREFDKEDNGTSSPKTSSFFEKVKSLFN
jgi:molecular chaperone DnaJ